MQLPLEHGLYRVKRCDPDSRILADRHYSRQTIGAVEFMPPGRTMVLRNWQGTIVFAWLWQEIRDDSQEGYCCSIFRNESDRLSSDVILEAERLAASKWGPNRMFTYVAPGKIQSSNPGYCFQCAGWKKIGRSKSGLILLAKERAKFKRIKNRQGMRMPKEARQPLPF